MNRLPPVVLSALVALAALVGLVVPAASASAAVAPVGGTVSKILVWGDSMTLVWPGYLAELLGTDVVNMGAGGETIQETQVRFDAWVAANPGQTSVGHICWCGHVNGNRQNNNLPTILPVMQAMAAQVPVDRFMPIGLTNGPDEGMGTAGYKKIVKGVNVDLASGFGAYYAEVRRYLVTDGLRVAGLTPTTEDQANIYADVPPASLRTTKSGNPAHLNDTGRHVTASRLNDLVRGLGWVYTNPDLLASATAVSSTLNPSTSGTPIRLQARVGNLSGDPGTPTGTVTFQIGRKVVGTFALRDGVATSTAGGTLPEGNNIITAYYNGDESFATSSGSFTQVVQPAP